MLKKLKELAGPKHLPYLCAAFKGNLRFALAAAKQEKTNMISIETIGKIRAGAILQQTRERKDSPISFQTVVVARLVGRYVYLLTPSGLKAMPLDKARSLWDVSITSNILDDLLIFMNHDDCFEAIRRQYPKMLEKCLTIDENEFSGTLPHWR